MAETSTYKPKGNTLSPYEDSAKLKLKSVTQPVLEEFKTSGKVDANALNELAKTQNANLTEIVKYMLELINQQSDTTTDKLKTELKSLADSLVTDLKTASSSEAETEENSNNQHADIESKLQEIKETLGKDAAVAVDNEKVGNYTNVDIANDFQVLQDFVQRQMTKLEVKLPKLILPKFSFPKLKLPKFKFPKFSFPKLKLPKFKFPTLKLPKLQPLKKIKAIGSKMKNVASKAKNAVVKPFAAIGSFFKKLAFGSGTKFTFPKLQKFLKNFFSFKNVGKWLTGFLKKQVKIFQQMVAKIIKPIKKMLFGAIELLLNGLGRLLFIYLGPVAIVAWTILALVTLIAVGLVLAVIWVKNWIKKNWTKIVAFVKDIPKKIWNGIKWLGKMIWKGIRFIFFDMWVMLGKWVWNKVLKPFGRWINEKVIQPIYKFIKDKYDRFIKPIIDVIKEKYNKYIQPLVDSLSDLKKTIFNAFSWDSSKTVIENLMQIWTNIKNAVKNWWETSPFKTYYDKIVSWLSDMLKPLTDWLNQQEWYLWLKGTLKSLMDSIKQVWDNIKSKGFGVWFKEKISKVWEELLNFGKRLKDWWDSLGISKKIDDIFSWIKDLPSKLWEKIKGFFGGVGKAVSWVGDKLAGGVEAVKSLFKKDEKVDPMQNALDQLNKERERTIEIDVGSIKDILDLVTQMSEFLVKTIDIKLDSILGTKLSDTASSKQYSIDNSYKTLTDITANQKVEVPEIETNNDQSDDKLDDIGMFLSKFADATRQNFELILQKLDEKPNLIPIPFANTDMGNTALMENM